jgi:hypothetical protein
MLSVSVIVFSTGQKKVLRKTLKYLRTRVDFSGLEVHRLISDDYVDDPKIDNATCRAFIKELAVFEYCYFPETNQGFGGVINYMYRQVKASYVLHLEHDWKFLRAVAVRPLIEIMEAHAEITCIRFNKKITKAAPQLFWLDEPERQRQFGPYVLTETRSWTTNPTLWRTAHMVKALPIDDRVDSERSMKANLTALGFRSYSLGRPGETYVKHLKGIQAGEY